MQMNTDRLRGDRMCHARARSLVLVAVSLLALGCTEQYTGPRARSSGLPTEPAPPPPTPAATSGKLRVAVITEGAELAPYGYAVMLDGVITSLTAANEVTTLDVSVGSHQLQIGGIPPECDGDGRRSRPVTVVAGAETTESFAITCSTSEALTPDTLTPVRVSVKVVSEGPDVDPNGYYVRFERQQRAKWAYWTGSALGANDSIALTLPVGSFAVSLIGVAPNCMVAPGFLQFEAESADVLVKFTVACTALPDSQGIRVTTVTTGAELDTDGYTVHVENDLDENGDTFAWSGPVASNGSLMVPKVPMGVFRVWLSGVARNCIVVPSFSASMWVETNETSSVKFQVLCFTPVSSP